MCCSAASLPRGIYLGISFLAAYLLYEYNFHSETEQGGERETLKLENSYLGDRCSFELPVTCRGFCVCSGFA